jgi:hypothetical protein
MKKQTPSRAKPKGLAESAAEYDPGPGRKTKRQTPNFPKVTASEFAKNFGEYREEALVRPIAVTSHGRTVGYFVSPAHFEQYLRLMPPRRAVRTVDLPESTIRAIANARVPKKYDYLNALLDED